MWALYVFQYVCVMFGSGTDVMVASGGSLANKRGGQEEKVDESVGVCVRPHIIQPIPT